MDFFKTKKKQSEESILCDTIAHLLSEIKDLRSNIEWSKSFEEFTKERHEKEVKKLKKIIENLKIKLQKKEKENGNN